MGHLFVGAESKRRKERLVAQAQGRVLTTEPATLFDPSFQKGGYDTIVSVRVLCAVDDIDAALRRYDELLAPNGRILVLEHTRMPGIRGLVQDATAPLWRRSPLGCHADRDPVAALRRNGFAVTDLDRFREPRSLPIVARYVSAVAIRKATPPVQENKQ